MNMKKTALSAIAFSLAASVPAADIDIPIGFDMLLSGCDKAERATEQCVRQLEGLSPGATFEAWLETDIAPDVHWFGAYLRRGKVRFSIHQHRHQPGGCWTNAAASVSGRARVAYRGVVGESGRLDLDFDCVRSPNPAAPTLEEIRRLGARPHPRLFITDLGVFDRIRGSAATNSAVAATLDQIRRRADVCLTEQPGVYMDGGEKVPNNLAIERTTCLIIAWKTFGERKYLDRLEKELRAYAAYHDWTPSHYLDTALYTYVLSIAYDWLYDDWSAETREVLADAIQRLGLGEARPDAFWIHNGNNWAQVCNACMSYGSIAIAERCPELAHRLISDAVTTLHEPLESYAPDGGFIEGVGYWNFGTLHTALAIDAFKAAFGTDFGLLDEPGFAKSWMFPAMMLGPSGLYFNHSDCAAKAYPMTSLWWFAGRLNRPDIVAGHETKLWVEEMKKPVAVVWPEYNFHQLLWMCDIPSVPAPTLPTAHAFRGTVPVAIQSTDRSDPDMFWGAIKGGNACLSHAHADPGSFVFDACGERWAHDPGSVNYGFGLSKFGMKFWDNNSLDSPRWSFFRLGPQGHNLVTVNSRNPDIRTDCPIARFEDFGKNGSVASFDTSRLYPIATNGASRTAWMSFAPKSWRLVDEFRGVPIGTEFTWRMNTYADVKIDGRKAILSQNGKRLVLVASAGEWKVETPDLSNERPSPGLRQLQLAVKATSPDVSWSVVFRVPDEADFTVLRAAAAANCPVGTHLVRACSRQGN